ncbi:bifunctional DNA-formamidopyrimidine glycosylase/DNA-(apurinic or apyrimidinic site) lyase [Polymorphobacter fuscus]|uniref:Formamidopyrimidine-DNA glycosylase n=1 Tax=Sandarakinorhabdus fusca TaxID=1439888 RepID=A0A7C9KYI7_9SPHN|nr:bifunctional DNA-formamidopyrimidine glycosylase/DNA-(apurinic or apyrimidinic site) lyase [Polymorphobacter fuscus]KAB7644067.1 bifunctional DNA-formamidopyrimidine glycosylase/DNA-(apurinic or apyrimidinic site) lyase [Polymorphobacter fuscus]MQT18442.1 bifunctional DNA-formamidopyrimidine glycosylase/DNA-(apurinic or apyrimidinic site) lyase [Polymorphobacter fuscus]NJC08437.1 formamidopyrimidine-DNA glycosylase [Polymorphobacter fuscus]
MPELPEVETVMRGLAPVWMGQRFARITLNRADLRRPFPDGLGQRLTGAVVTGCRRRAKYGLVDTDRGDTMIVHLGMSGRMRVDPEAIGKHDHVVFETGNGRQVAFNDARRFGSIDLVETSAVAAHPLLAGLGPEPLGPDFGAAMLAAAFRGRMAPAKALLLDQRIVAGLGNIYVCEALFRAGIHPGRAGGQVAARRISLLVDSVRAVLLEAIAAGGSSLRDHAAPDGTLGYFQKGFQVYGQEGKPCPVCARPVQRIVQSGRSSFFCARCQR